METPISVLEDKLAHLQEVEKREKQALTDKTMFGGTDEKVQAFIGRIRSKIIDFEHAISILKNQK